jgi:hypothetical protein
MPTVLTRDLCKSKMIQTSRTASYDGSNF